MAAPADDGRPRTELERLALAAIGALALSAERAEELVAEGLPSGWSPAALARELGLVTREDLEELDLRLAQLEHRLSLLED